jgi:hypothetical protein
MIKRSVFLCVILGCIVLVVWRVGFDSGGDGLGSDSRTAESPPPDVPIIVESDNADIAIDTQRGSLEPRVSVNTAPEGGDPSSHKDDKSVTASLESVAEANPSSTPLERLRASWFRGPLEDMIGQVENDSLSRSMRLHAARQILVHDIALTMEQAGTALPMVREGHSGAPYPSRPKFYKDGRAYCFEDVEFPLWVEVNTYRGDDTATPTVGFWGDTARIGRSIINNLQKE